VVPTGPVSIAPSIPVDDAEAAALYLVEIMRPSVRLELARRLMTVAAFG
jgi:hypothetical protein